MKSNVLSRLTKFLPLIEKLREWSTGKEYAYDIECYPNFFSMAVVHVKTLQEYYFECSPWMNNMNDFNNFMYFLHGEKQEMVGFNNEGYDFPVIAHAFRLIPHGQVTPEAIYEKSNAIINGGWDNRYDHVIWPNDQFVSQIDLFKMNHYDNSAKRTSLKLLEFNMGMDDIQELPVEPGKPVTAEEAAMLRPYNWHDVAATLLFMAQCIGMFDLRRIIGQQYNTNMMSFNDGKIGNEIFKQALKEAGLPVNQKTPRDIINFKDCIFSYVQFERPEFQAVYTWLLNTSVTKTKECLNNITVEPWLAQYMNPDEVKVINVPDSILSTIKLRKGQTIYLSMLPNDYLCYDYGSTFIATHLHCVVDGFQFDFGTGGIHGSLKNKIVRACNGKRIIDVDVASYYPNLGIKNSLFPAHLGLPFCECYEGLYETRKKYPKKQFPKENTAFKLALNTAYGNSNSQYSFLYDPQYTMTITLNGQLLLCMLAEQMMKTPTLEMIQINTDGMTYRVDDFYVQHTMALCRWWEQITKLELEDVEYKTMYIRDVNNYIAEYLDGGLKNKGAYEHTLAEQGLWHKNFNRLVVAKAAEEALVRGKSTREFIENHDNLMDFMCRTKVQRTDTVYTVDNDGKRTQQQRVTRYIAAVVGDEIIKVMPPTPAQVELYATGDHYQHESTGAYEVKKAGRKPSSGKYKPVPDNLKRTVPDRVEQLEAECRVQPCNTLNDQVVNQLWDNLNYDFYINEANKLVDILEEY